MPTHNQGQDLGQYSPWLKEWYMTNWIDLLAGSTTTWQMFRQDVTEYRGAYMVIPLRTRRNASPQAIARSTTAGAGFTQLADPGHQGVSYARAAPRLLTGAIGLPQDSMDQAKSSRGTFYDMVDFEMMGLLRDFKDRLDAMCYDAGDGRIPFALDPITRGTYTNCPSILAVDVVNDTIHVPNGAYFFPGKRLTFYTDAYVEVKPADFATNTDWNGYYICRDVERQSDGITAKIRLQLLDAEPDVTLTDVHDLVASGAAGNQSNMAQTYHIHDYGFSSVSGGKIDQQFGLRGLTAMISDSNPPGEDDYLSRNRDNVLSWRANMDRTNGKNDNYYNWTDGDYANPDIVIQKNIDTVHDNSNGEIDTMLMSRRGSRQIQAIQKGLTASSSKQRFVNTLNVQHGLVNRDQDKHPGSSNWLMWNEDIPMIVDRYAGPYVDYTQTVTASVRPMYQPIWMFDSSTIYIGMVSDFSWWDVNGIFDKMPGTNNYKFGVVGNVYALLDFICDAPNRNTCITASMVGGVSIT